MSMYMPEMDNNKTKEQHTMIKASEDKILKILMDRYDEVAGDMDTTYDVKKVHEAKDAILLYLDQTYSMKNIL